MMLSEVSHPQSCPIGHGVDETRLGALWKDPSSPMLCGYPRAGGYFGMEVSGVNPLNVQPPTDRVED